TENAQNGSTKEMDSIRCVASPKKIVWAMQKGIKGIFATVLGKNDERTTKFLEKLFESMANGISCIPTTDDR
ncbi:unnamed protein product, partial [Ceratitis capitata]